MFETAQVKSGLNKKVATRCQTVRSTHPKGSWDHGHGAKITNIVHLGLASTFAGDTVYKQ